MKNIVEELKIQAYKDVIHCMDDIVLFYNRDGKIINWNTETVNKLYYDRDDLINVTLKELFREEAYRFFFSSEEKRTMSQFETAVYRNNGTCFRASIKLSLLDNEYAYGMCIIRSLEEIRELEEKLEAAKKEVEEAKSAKNSFLANVTHELRTPLNGMKGMANLLLGSGLTKEQHENVTTMIGCFETMEHIVNDILDYAKLTAGKMQIEEHGFSFPSWINGIVAVHKRLIEQKNLRFELNVEESIPTHLIGDSYHLTQVVNNLMNNAIKFTEQGKIVLDIAVQQREAERIKLLFSVTDTGIGISQEKKSELFQSFVQGDPSITRKYGGTGLGLSICRELISLMGGEIQAESEYGKGSRFYFTVWLKEEQEIEKAQAEEEAIVHEVIGTKTVKEMMEQLKLCLEFGAYEKAEETVHLIKEASKVEDKEASKKAFRLELAIRKRNTEKIKAQYLELLQACEHSRKE